MRNALTAFALLLAGTAAAQPAPTPPAAVQGAEDVKLRKIFADSDEAMLKRQPVLAIFRGDLRHADRLGDYYTDAYVAAERAAVERDLDAIQKIDRARLNPVNQIAYDVFKADQERALRGFAPDVMGVTKYLPIDHFTGFQAFYPGFASGQGAAPFKTVLDYENNLKRNAQYAAAYDRVIGLFREGMKRGIVQPKLVVRNMIDQFDKLNAPAVEDSLFHGPVKQFPDGISAADQTRLRAAYAAQVRDVIVPAHKRIRDFLANEYLPAARESVGTSALPGGAAVYAYAILSNTTLPLTADTVHDLGLAEVKRILTEMEAQKTKVGITGSLADFFAHLRTDKRFQPASAQAVRASYAAIGKRVDARVREQFSLIPKSPLEIRPVPDFRAQSAAAGSYEPGTPDGSRPGVFFYNTYDLPNRYSWGEETLYLHEAAPGHHFQISLAQENAALPAFMRFGGNTAYVEGWALYAETLHEELGVAVEPYQRMGGLSDEMLRAMRLVVDTGLHAKGWSRDQAIKYMMANSPMPQSDAVAEVERYIAMPGQALAYKIGQLTISRGKAKARAALGDRFDPRGFHAMVLDTGSLPMPVLEKKIDDWIAAQR